MISRRQFNHRGQGIQGAKGKKQPGDFHFGQSHPWPFHADPIIHLPGHPTFKITNQVHAMLV
jgi:hypothetical protein